MKDSFMGDAVGGDLRPAQVACKNGATDQRRRAAAHSGCGYMVGRSYHLSSPGPQR
jgi:hypothetical protein